jgi:hypothetical protein
MACYSGIRAESPPTDAADGGGSDSGGSGTGSDGAGPDTEGEEPACDVGRTGLQRLTRRQYNNAIQDLFGDESRPADAFVPDDKTGVFANNATSGVSTLHVEDYAAAAEAIAQRVATTLPEFLDCDPVTAGETACAEQFIAETGRRVFRRPVSAEETAGLMGLFQHDASADLQFSDRIELVLAAMLQSSAFLYRLEFGLQDAEGSLVPLTSYEMASRLSFFLWASIPDDELLDVADVDGLRTAEELAVHAERMIEDPRFEAALESFHQQWLGVEALAAVPKNTDAFPEYTPELVAAIEEESTRFVVDVIREGDGRLETLLTSPVAWVDPRIAELYGVEYPGEGSGFERVVLDAAERPGLLSRAMFTATHSGPTLTSPVLRGVTVRESVFCLTHTPPPSDVDLTPPEPEPGATTREIYESHMEAPLCKSCHASINPVGFAFENYDAIGRFRRLEEGLPIDASGELIGTDVDGSFAGPTDFIDLAARSDLVRECVAEHWTTFATGRAPGEADACSQETVFAQFQDSDYDIRALLVAIVTSDAFRHQPRED